MRAPGRHKLGDGFRDRLRIHLVFAPQILLRANDGRKSGSQSNPPKCIGLDAGVHARLGNEASKSTVNRVLLDGNYSTRLTACAQHRVVIEWLDRMHAYHAARDALLDETVGCLECSTQNSTGCNQRYVSAFADRACLADVEHLFRASSRWGG